MLNRQMVFDDVARHLLTQKRHALSGSRILLPHERPFDENGVFLGCEYRNGTLKCAIGVLIPDAKYSRDMEGVFATSLVHGHRDCLDAKYGSVDPDNGDAKFLADLQGVHDRSAVDQWRDRLRQEAQRYGLSTRVLDEVQS